MSSAFKRRTIAPERVAAAESAAASTPPGGDPRSISTDITNVHTETADAVRQVGSVGAVYEVGKVYDIPVETIKSNPFNPRAVYTSAAIDEMAISLRDQGQKISATAYVEDGKVILIEGETRLRGCRSIGIATLRVEIKTKPPSDKALYEEARAANVERRDQTPIDDAVKWKELIERGVYKSQAEIAKALNLGEDHVSRVMKLNSLSRTLLTAIADYPELHNLRMLNALREFFEARNEQETLEIILTAIDKGWGYRDIEARRKAATEGPIRRTRGATQAVQYGTAKGEIKTFEEGGRLQLELKGLTPEESQGLVSVIKDVLARSSQGQTAS